MCGINGIYTYNTNNNYSDTVKLMNKNIAHRGPDAEGIYNSKNICLGHRRLSIIDLNEVANQPLIDMHGRFSIVFNGEIYNYRELKQELNFDFKSSSDTEVIIAAYDKWGVNCLEKLEGMFAFAIWDNQEETLFIARDRIGIKPLYYYKDEHKLIFSSSIKAIAKSKIIKAEINSNQLSSYIQFHTVYSPNTLVKDVYSLESGSYIYIEKNSFSKKKYWNIREYAKVDSSISYKDAKKNIKELLDNSVKQRLVSDVDFGAFLSGGIDSTLMLALMTKHSNSKIKTFNVAFGEKKYNESKYAEETALKYNSDHHTINLDANELLDEIIPALNSIDFPSTDGINTYIVSKKTREAGIKMAISGLGGDELFAGYPQFKQIDKLNKLSYLDKIPVFIRSNIAKVLLKKKDNRSLKLAKWLELKSWDFQSIYPSFRDQKYFGDSILNSLPLHKNNYFDLSSPLNNLSVNEIDLYLENVLLRDSDQMSMANSLELRVPFMDHKLVEYVLSLSDDFKYPHTQKRLLTDSFPEVFTQEMLSRKKMGFVFPWNIWLKNEMKDFVEQRLKYLEKHSYFNHITINKMWKEFLLGDRRVSWTQIWSLVVLSHWIEDTFE